MLRLDYISCVLTILSTVLVGRKIWCGWFVTGVNSLLICIIGVRTAQFGFIPTNALCIALHSYNLRAWRMCPQQIGAAQVADPARRTQLQAEVTGHQWFHAEKAKRRRTNRLNAQ